MAPHVAKWCALVAFLSHRCEARCMWKETANCDPNGAHESQHDKSCYAEIASQASGYCDCNGDGQRNNGEPGYDCSSTPVACYIKCAELEAAHLMTLQSGLGLCSGPASDFSSGAGLPSGFALDASVVGYRACGGVWTNVETCKQACIDGSKCNSMSHNNHCCFLYEAKTCTVSSHSSTSHYTTYYKIEACPSACTTCKDGGPTGVALVNGKCTKYCSQYGNCGTNSAFVNSGTDCRGCEALSTFDMQPGACRDQNGQFGKRIESYSKTLAECKARCIDLIPRCDAYDYNSQAAWCGVWGTTLSGIDAANGFAFVDSGSDLKVVQGDLQQGVDNVCYLYHLYQASTWEVFPTGKRPCGDADTDAAMEGMDLSGGDSATTAIQCQDACVAQSQCNAFSFSSSGANGRHCYLKYKPPLCILTACSWWSADWTWHYVASSVVKSCTLEYMSSGSVSQGLYFHDAHPLPFKHNGNVSLAYFTNAPEFLWQFVFVEGNASQFRNVLTKKQIQRSGGHTSSGTVLVSWDMQHYNADWTFKAVENQNDIFVIEAANSGTYMVPCAASPCTNPQANQTAGAKVVLWDYTIWWRIKIANNSASCDDYMTETGCDWTIETACPGQMGPVGQYGALYGDDGSLGYKCCCTNGGWRQAVCGNPLFHPADFEGHWANYGSVLLTSAGSTKAAQCAEICAKNTSCVAFTLWGFQSCYNYAYVRDSDRVLNSLAAPQGELTYSGTYSSREITCLKIATTTTNFTTTSNTTTTSTSTTSTRTTTTSTNVTTTSNTTSTASRVTTRTSHSTSTMKNSTTTSNLTATETATTTTSTTTAARTAHISDTWNAGEVGNTTNSTISSIYSSTLTTATSTPETSSKSTSTSATWSTSMSTIMASSSGTSISTSIVASSSTTTSVLNESVLIGMLSNSSNVMAASAAVLESVLASFVVSNETQKISIETEAFVVHAETIPLQSIDKDKPFVEISKGGISVSIPTSFLQQLYKEGKSGLVSAVMILHKGNNSHFGAGAQSLGGELVGHVLSVDLCSVNTGDVLAVSGLQTPIVLTMSVFTSGATCSYWDESKNVWSQAGMTTVSSTNTSLQCGATHLSFFGGLVLGGLSEALECASVVVFTPKGLSRVLKGDWWYSEAAIMYWLLLLTLLSIIMLALVKDRKWKKEGLWDYRNLFVSSNSVVHNHKQGTTGIHHLTRLHEIADALREARLSHACCKPRIAAQNAYRFLEGVVLARIAAFTLSSYHGIALTSVCKKASWADATNTRNESLSLMMKDAMENGSKELEDFFSRRTSIFRRMFVIFRWLQPCYMAAHFSPVSTMALRALVFDCHVLGSIMVLSLFYSSSGLTSGVGSDKKCTESSGLLHELVQDTIIGYMSTVLMHIPMLLFVILHKREFIHLDPWDEELVKKVLRRWKVHDRIIWWCYLLFLSFCVYFVTVFLANLSPASQRNWIRSSCWSMFEILLIAPLRLAVIFAVIATMVAYCQPGAVERTEARIGLSSRSHSNTNPVCGQESTPEGVCLGARSSTSTQITQADSLDTTANPVNTALTMDSICVEVEPEVEPCEPLVAFEYPVGLLDYEDEGAGLGISEDMPELAEWLELPMERHDTNMSITADRFESFRMMACVEVQKMCDDAGLEATPYASSKVDAGGHYDILVLGLDGKTKPVFVDVVVGENASGVECERELRMECLRVGLPPELQSFRHLVFGISTSGGLGSGAQDFVKEGAEYAFGQDQQFSRFVFQQRQCMRFEGIFQSSA